MLVPRDSFSRTFPHLFIYLSIYVIPFSFDHSQMNLRMKNSSSSSPGISSRFLAHFALSLLLFFGYQTQTLAADLVLPSSYELVEVSRDATPYEGDDGLLIHGGDHYHDPCDTFTNATGVKFTTGRDEDNANGFLVINDCQVTSCRKWTSPNGKYGGATIVYDIVPVEGEGEGERDDESGAKDIKFRVIEESDCVCGEDCYVGLFVHVQDAGDCEVFGGTPGSIPCTDAEEQVSSPWIYSGLGGNGVNEQTDTLSRREMAGIVVAAVIFSLLLCCCCCCCRRKNKKGNNHDGDDDNNDVEQAKAQPEKVRSRWFGSASAPASASDSVDTDDSSVHSEKKSTDTSWFGRKSKFESKPAEVQSLSSIAPPKQSQPQGTSQKNEHHQQQQQQEKITKASSDEPKQKSSSNETMVPDNTEPVECNCWCT